MLSSNYTPFSKMLEVKLKKGDLLSLTSRMGQMAFVGCVIYTGPS